MGKFLGYYYKVQKGDNSVAFIAGHSCSGAFLQVLFNGRALFYTSDRAEIRGSAVTVCGCSFSKDGASVALDKIKGELIFSNHLTLSGDIMGYFRFLPMECRHTVVSMKNEVSGSLEIEGELYDFDGGTGYIEGDRGRSFPQKYAWIQANDFDNASVFMSVADIPLCGFRFCGCIAAVIIDGREYRLATYNGARATAGSGKIRIIQRGLVLSCTLITDGDAASLISPEKGSMNGVIRESTNVVCEILLCENGREVWRGVSRRAAAEFNI